MIVCYSVVTARSSLAYFFDYIDKPFIEYANAVTMFKPKNFRIWVVISTSSCSFS